MTANKLHSRLPNYKAPNQAWEGIAEVLDSLESDSNNVAPMDNQVCPEGLWDNISLQLDALDSDKKTTLIADKLPEYTTAINFNSIQKERVRYHWLKVAAAIVILIGISGTLLNKLSQTKETISYSLTEVIIEENSFTMPEAFPSLDFEIVLQQFCSEKPQICQNQDYEMLNKQLEHIKVEEQNLQKLQEQHKDQNIYKMMMQLQNDKTQIEKTLLMLF